MVDLEAFALEATHFLYLLVRITCHYKEKVGATKPLN